MIITIELRDELPTLEKRRALTQITELLNKTAETITQLTRGSGEEVELVDRAGKRVATVIFINSA